MGKYRALLGRAHRHRLAVDADLQRSQHAELGTLLGHHRNCDLPVRLLV
jgi:hypothetical protein